MKNEAPPTNWISLFVFMAMGYLCIFAEARLTAFRDLTGAQLDFLPGLMVYAGLAHRPAVALTGAGLLGLMWDSLSANPLGVTALTLGIVTALTLHFRELLLSEQFITHWLLGLAASALAPIISLLLLSAAGAAPLTGAGSLWQWAIVTAGGGLMTPVWFKIFRRLDDALRYKEAPEMLYRGDRQIARGRH